MWERGGVGWRKRIRSSRRLDAIHEFHVTLTFSFDFFWDGNTGVRIVVFPKGRTQTTFSESSAAISFIGVDPTQSLAFDEVICCQLCCKHFFFIGCNIMLYNISRYFFYYILILYYYCCCCRVDVSQCLNLFLVEFSD